MFDKLQETLGPKVGNALLKTRAHSPEIYLAGGILGGIASAVMFARAHKSADEHFVQIRHYIDEVKADIQETNEAAVEETGHEAISRAEEQKMLTPLYGEFALEAVKHYGPALVLGTVSVALILTSHGTMRDRNKALLSTVALVERSFSTYRKRVVAELGEEADERYYYGANQRKVVILEEGKDGKTKKTRTKQNVLSEEPSAIMYGRVFDRNNPRWTADRDLNELFLRSAQDTLNWQLKTRGHVFLNDVYDALGFKRSDVGAVVGWCTELPGGDGFVALGLDKSINWEGDNRWMIDPNVQGNILEGLRNDGGVEFPA